MAKTRSRSRKYNVKTLTPYNGYYIFKVNEMDGVFYEAKINFTGNAVATAKSLAALKRKLKK